MNTTSTIITTPSPLTTTQQQMVTVSTVEVEGAPIRVGIFTWNQALHNYCQNVVDTSRAAAASKKANTCVPPRFIKQAIDQMMDVKTGSLPDIIVVALQEGNGSGRDGLLDAFDEYLTSLPWTATAEPADLLPGSPTRPPAAARASWVTRVSLLQAGGQQTPQQSSQQFALSGADLVTRPIMGTRYQVGDLVRQLSMRIWMRTAIDRQYVFVARQELVPSLTRDVGGLGVLKETQVVMLLLAPRVAVVQQQSTTQTTVLVTDTPVVAATMGLGSASQQQQQAVQSIQTIGDVPSVQQQTTTTTTTSASSGRPQVQFIALFHSHLPIDKRVNDFKDWIDSKDPILHKRGITLRDIMPFGKNDGQTEHLGLTNRLLDMQNVWAQFNSPGGIRERFLREVARVLPALPAAVVPSPGTRISVAMFWFGDLNFYNQTPPTIKVKEYVDAFGRKSVQVDRSLESGIGASTGTPTGTTTTTTTTVVAQPQQQFPGLPSVVVTPPPITFVDITSTPTPSSSGLLGMGMGVGVGTPTASSSVRAISGGYDVPLTEKRLLEELKFTRDDARLQFDQLDRIRRFDDCMAHRYPLPAVIGGNYNAQHQQLLAELAVDMNKKQAYQSAYDTCFNEVGGDRPDDDDVKEAGLPIGLPPFVEGQFFGVPIAPGSTQATFAEVKFAPTCWTQSISKTLKGLSNRKHAQRDYALEAVCAADPYDHRCYAMGSSRMASYCQRQLQWGEQFVSIRTLLYDAVRLQPQSGMQASDHIAVIGVYDIVPMLLV